MREPRMVQDYLRDILVAMDKAEDFVFDLDLSAFIIDGKTAFAVIRSLEIIGEAVKKIPPDQRRPFPNIRNFSIRYGSRTTSSNSLLLL